VSSLRGAPQISQGAGDMVGFARDGNSPLSMPATPKNALSDIGNQVRQQASPGNAREPDRHATRPSPSSRGGQALSAALDGDQRNATTVSGCPLLDRGREFFFLGRPHADNKESEGSKIMKVGSGPQNLGQFS